jgi:hypothetical protein
MLSISSLIQPKWSLWLQTSLIRVTILPSKNSIPFLSFFHHKFVSVVESVILPPNYPDRFSATMTKIKSRLGDHFHPSLELQPGQRDAPTFVFSHKGYMQAEKGSNLPLTLTNRFMYLPWVNSSRGRNAGYPAPPAQIPSMRNYRTGLLPQVKRRNVALLLVPCSVRSTLLPAPVCRSRPSEHSSPRPEAFSPRTPPVVGRLPLVVHLCSFASSILFLRPTSQARSCRASAFGLPRPGRLWMAAGRPWDLPVSVQRVCVHAPGL